MLNENKSGCWLGTYTGKKFWPLNPNPEDVCLEDIAHALSNLCRFNGHSKEFYSVAEHCLNVEALLEGSGFNVKWRPSIHMPKEAARIFLEVTDLRVERVQDITEEDARKEGFSSRLEFGTAWDSIYNNWDENPWTWVFEFERCEKP